MGCEYWIINTKGKILKKGYDFDEMHKKWKSMSKRDKNKSGLALVQVRCVFEPDNFLAKGEMWEKLGV